MILQDLLSKSCAWYKYFWALNSEWNSHFQKWCMIHTVAPRLQCGYIKYIRSTIKFCKTDEIQSIYLLVFRQPKPFCIHIYWQRFVWIYSKTSGWDQWRLPHDVLLCKEIYRFETYLCPYQLFTLTKLIRAADACSYSHKHAYSF